MAWVKAEYAGELAVVSAWIAALTPWSLTFQPEAPAGSFMFMVRFPLLELQIRLPLEVTRNGEVIGRADAVLAESYPGVEVLGAAFVTNPIGAAGFYDQQSLVLGSVAWAAGGAVVVLALALSVWLYRNEEAVGERLPFDEVRTMGALLAVAALCFAAATVGYLRGSDLVGVPVPVGVLVLGALAVVLLRVERV